MVGVKSLFWTQCDECIRTWDHTYWYAFISIHTLIVWEHDVSSVRERNQGVDSRWSKDMGEEDKNECENAGGKTGVDVLFV